jgi:hypothetical protein
VTISNVEPRLDTAGRIVNAHDGSLLLNPHDGRYWLYGTHYEACPTPPSPPGPGVCSTDRTCGWYRNTFAAYSSPDLSSGSWRLESASIAPGLEANNSRFTYFMPNVLFNAAHNNFVLAFNPNGSAFVATSSAPAGPFTILGTLALQRQPLSQFDTWLDPLTGIAYARYNAQLNASTAGMCVEQLAPDFLSSAAGVPASCFATPDMLLEGGGIFRRGDRIYVMGGRGCCFCEGGGNARTYASDSGPLGAYAFVGDVNPFLPCNSSAPAPEAALAAAQEVPAPAPSCANLSGAWQGFDAPGGCPMPGMTLAMSAAGDGAFTAHDAGWDRDGNGTVTANGSVALTLYWAGGAHLVEGEMRAAYGGAPCSEIAWTSAGHEAERWCRQGFCGPGEGGGRAAVPAQQFQVFSIDQAGGAPSALLFFGERWGSAPTGLKSDDFEAWQPLNFNADGSVVPFAGLVDSFELTLPAAGSEPAEHTRRGA